MKRFLVDFGAAAIVALALFIILAFLTRTGAIAPGDPFAYSTGFPLAYSHQNLPCPLPNPANGCGYSTNLAFVALDYVFWLAIASIIIFGYDTASHGFSSRPARKQEQETLRGGYSTAVPTVHKRCWTCTQKYKPEPRI